MMKCRTLELIPPNPESCVASDGADEEMKLTGDWLGPPFRAESHCEAADMGLSDLDDVVSSVSGEKCRCCGGLGGRRTSLFSEICVSGI